VAEVTDQLLLDGRTATEAKLTPRQAFALRVIREHAPISSAELGSRLHEYAGKHSHDQICRWDQSNGVEVARALAVKCLVKRKREGWVPEGFKPELPPSSQGELPEDF
jgi:hypothetical protein